MYLLHFCTCGVEQFQFFELPIACCPLPIVNPISESEWVQKFIVLLRPARLNLVRAGLEMTKPVFSISGAEINAETSAQATLLMEVNESAFSYVIVDENKKLLTAAYFVLSHTEGRNLADTIRDIVDSQEILQLDFKESIVVYNFSESTLVPGTFYNHDANRDLVDLLFGNLKKGLVLSEKDNESNLHTLYRVPAAVHSLLQQKFSAGKYWHIYTLWLSLLQKTEHEEMQSIYTVFAADKVLTAVYRNRALQLIQSFAYTTPEDVVYHLLHCCEQLGLSQDNCLLHISGYIDEDSALFTEIKKYFLRLEFDKLEGQELMTETPKEEFNETSPAEYPAHYFSYLQKLALCV